MSQVKSVFIVDRQTIFSYSDEAIPSEGVPYRDLPFDICNRNIRWLDRHRLHAAFRPRLDADWEGLEDYKPVGYKDCAYEANGRGFRPEHLDVWQVHARDLHLCIDALRSRLLVRLKEDSFRHALRYKPPPPPINDCLRWVHSVGRARENAVKARDAFYDGFAFLAFLTRVAASVHEDYVTVFREIPMNAGFEITPHNADILPRLRQQLLDGISSSWVARGPYMGGFLDPDDFEAPELREILSLALEPPKYSAFSISLFIKWERDGVVCSNQSLFRGRRRPTDQQLIEARGRAVSSSSALPSGGTSWGWPTTTRDGSVRGVEPSWGTSSRTSERRTIAPNWKSRPDVAETDSRWGQGSESWGASVPNPWDEGSRTDWRWTESPGESVLNPWDEESRTGRRDFGRGQGSASQRSPLPTPWPQTTTDTLNRESASRGSSTATSRPTTSGPWPAERYGLQNSTSCSMPVNSGGHSSGSQVVDSTTVVQHRIRPPPDFALSKSARKKLTKRVKLGGRKPDISDNYSHPERKSIDAAELDALRASILRDRGDLASGNPHIPKLLPGESFHSWIHRRYNYQRYYRATCHPQKLSSILSKETFAATGKLASTTALFVWNVLPSGQVDRVEVKKSDRQSEFCSRGPNQRLYDAVFDEVDCADWLEPTATDSTDLAAPATMFHDMYRDDDDDDFDDEEEEDIVCASMIGALPGRPGYIPSDLIAPPSAPPPPPLSFDEVLPPYPGPPVKSIVPDDRPAVDAERYAQEVMFSGHFDSACRTLLI